MHKSTSGFTIIELLVVIVVIGILATIMVVSYNGVQRRAIITSANVDLRNVSQQLDLFEINNGAYPVAVANPSFAMTDMANVLKEANVYTETRQGATRKKSFIYCVNSNYSEYIIAAVEPVYASIVIPPNELLYYRSSLYSGQRTMTVTTAGSNGANICKSISGNDSFLTGRWSFDTPLPGAS